MPDKRRAFGQFETPADVADLLLAFCLRNDIDRLLDPSCGEGAILLRALQWQRWLDTGKSDVSRLWGVELDPEAAFIAQSALPEANIVNENFFEMEPEPKDLFDVIVGNPPFTRSEWIDRFENSPIVDQDLARQLAIFDRSEDALGKGTRSSAESFILNKRAGLHAYFFLHGTGFLREGGRFGFVVPNNWLDIASGARLKQFLLEHYRILALVESTVERWFTQAKVNTSLVILERCDEPARRQDNQVRMIEIHQPLDKLFPYDLEDKRRFAWIKDLADKILAGAELSGGNFRMRNMTQRTLAPADKWGLRLRSPQVLLTRKQGLELHPLRNWASVQRGYTTGANSFFYLDLEAVTRWEIEPRYRRPLLKSLRHVHRRQVTEEQCDLDVLIVPAAEPLAGTAVGEYIAWGESQGIHLNRTTAGRRPWYALPKQETSPLLLAKGIWNRHFAPLVAGKIAVDQQLYQFYLADGVPLKAAAALLNSAWFELQLELNGRVNFGEGVLWLAGYELENLYLPDPRYLPMFQSDELVSIFEELLQRPVGNIQEETLQADWQALNAVVFDILGLLPSEGLAITEALQERMSLRQEKARSA